MDTLWRIEMLGGLRAQQAGQGDQVVTRFRSRATGLLLAYLAYPPLRAHPREELLVLLWPDAEPQAGRLNLRVALNSLRKQLEPPDTPANSVLQADHQNVRLNPDAVTTDVAEFEAALRQAALTPSPSPSRGEGSLQRAVELYHGDLLPGFYDEWVLVERERLAEAYRDALRQRTAALEQTGDLKTALVYARRLVHADPLQEEAHGALLRLYAAAGRPADVQRQYAELERLLREELGAVPSPEIRQLLDGLLRSPRVALTPQKTEGEKGRRGEGEKDERTGTDSPSPVVGGEWRDSPSAAGERRCEAPSTRRWGRGMGASEGEGRSPSIHLPLQFTRFFGREEEITRLQEMLSPLLPWPSRKRRSAPLAPSPRLVTLTGPGGTGKTRLAIEAARRVADAFPGGVWFVPLASLADARLIPGAIVDALGLQRSPNVEPLEQGAAFLNGLSIERSVLSIEPASLILHTPYSILVLDNFEHLVEEGAMVVRMLLERVPSLTCLVTSRQVLNLEGEREFPVMPLPTPDFEPPASLETQRHREISQRTPSPLPPFLPSSLLSSPSVALFVDRAQARRADFQITEQNAAAVTALCAKLEGIPLAIELAAAQARMWTPAQMLSQLEHRFDFLVSHRRDAIERHRTLRAAIEWSYRMLSPELQRFFARLSVFRGGWTVEAAEAVCLKDEGGQTSSFILHPSSLSLLEHLRESSLILAEEVDGEIRFRMLETLREFGEEQLEPEERAAAQERHLACFLALAEESEPHLHGPKQQEWIRRLETEHDNLREALRASLESRGEGREETGDLPPSREAGLRLVVALAAFWEARGFFVEGRQWCDRLLSAPTEVSDSGRARALWAAGYLAVRQGDVQAARPLLEESLALFRALGDRTGIARALGSLGRVVWRQGEMVLGRSLMEESVALYRELDDKAGLAHVLGDLGMAVRSDEARSRSLLEEGLALSREAGDLRQIAWRLSELGRHEEALALFQELGNREGIADTLINQGEAALHRGEVERAAALCAEGLTLYRELAIEAAIGWALHWLAHAAHAQGDLERAVALLEEALPLQRQQGNNAFLELPLLWLGHIALLQGEVERAKPFLIESLLLSQQCQNQIGIGRCLAEFAGVEAVEGRMQRAAHLLGAAEALLVGHVGDGRRFPQEQADYEAVKTSVCAVLGEEGFAEAFAEGQAMPLEQALACALEETNSPDEEKKA